MQIIIVFLSWVVRQLRERRNISNEREDHEELGHCADLILTLTIRVIIEQRLGFVFFAKDGVGTILLPKV